MIQTMTVGICFIVIGAVMLSSFATDSSCNEDILNSFVTIEGYVKTIEPETGKVFSPVGQALVFQRIDCKKCLQVAVTNEDGKYQMRVGEGKYRLIVRENVSKGGSHLASDQAEIVDAKDKITRNVFDIKLVRSKNPLDMTLSPPK